MVLISSCLYLTVPGTCLPQARGPAQFLAARTHVWFQNPQFPTFFPTFFPTRTGHWTDTAQAAQVQGNKIILQPRPHLQAVSSPAPGPTLTSERHSIQFTDALTLTLPGLTPILNADSGTVAREQKLGFAGHCHQLYYNGGQIRYSNSPLTKPLSRATSNTVAF